MPHCQTTNAEVLRFNSSITWRLEVSGSTMTGFHVISSTNPFNAKLYDAIVPMIQELLKRAFGNK